jgi:topoisomerase IA-like protein
VQLGEGGDDEKPKMASLLAGMDPGDLTLDVALRLLALPREMGASRGRQARDRGQRPLWALCEVG